MTCWLWRLLADLFPDAAGALRSRLDRHAACCPHCRSRADFHRQLARTLKTCAAGSQPVANPRLAAEVLRRARSRDVAAAVQAERAESHRTLRPAWAVAAVAAVAILLVAILVMPFRSGISTGRGGKLASTAPAKTHIVAAQGLPSLALALDQFALLPEVTPLEQEGHRLLADLRAAGECVTSRLGGTAALADPQ